ncbi:MAG: hypothetical protein JNL11_05165 [Bdellovibrionaceae bacterium]|nr:hypothetical protein [Pseudobdellovibrionaceae bacterium]
MKTLFCLVFLLILSACSGDGTNTGNPTVDGSTPNSGQMPVTGNESQILANALCNKIAACFTSSSEATCKAQVPTLANFTDEILLNPPYTTLNDLETDVQNKTFTFNSASLNTCLNSIANLSCGDSLVTSSYSTSSPSSFSNIYKLFRASSHCLSLKY